jgi:hypothetical protein
MTFTVLLKRENGQFTASLVGAPDVRVSSDTRDRALSELSDKIALRIADGELVTVEVEPAGILSLAGRFADDPTLRAICDEAYRERDKDRP